MDNTKFFANTRFVFPPQMRWIASPQIDDSFDAMRTKEERQETEVGLGRAGSLARFYPVKIVR